MRFRSILSEAGRNIVSGTTRAALMAGVLAVLAGSLAVVDARAIVELQRRASDFVAAGASIQALVAKERTDAVACERLGEVAGIRAAGAMRPADTVVPRAMVANPIPAYEVTPGFLKVLGAEPSGNAGVWLPAQVAEILHLAKGARLATTSGALTVAGTYFYPEDGRDSRLNYAVLLPRPATGSFDECWADIWPVSERTESLLYAAIVVSPDPGDEPVNIAQANTSLGTEFDGAAEFTARPTRYGLPASVVIGFVIGFFSVRRRRLELAGGLHVGLRPRALVGMVLIETAAWAAAAFVLCASALVPMIWHGGPANAGEIYMIDIRGPAAAAIAALGGAACAAVTIRERLLFRYFKDRG